MTGPSEPRRLPIPPPPPQVVLTEGGTGAPPPRRRRALIVVAVVVAVAVVAGVAVAMSGRDDRTGAASHTPTSSASSSAVERPAAPRSMKAHAEAFAVTLTWKPGEGGATVDGYTIYRNRRLLTNVPGGATHSYVDKKALPESRYRYEVVAYGGTGGAISDGRASVRVRTPTGPVAMARFEGTFNVHLHVTSSYGVSGTQDSTAGWRLVPVCSTGPCNVKMVDLHHQIPATILKRSGATYQGSGSGKLGTVCGSTKTTSTFHVTLHAIDARSTVIEWRVTKFEGTFTSSEPAGFGCVAGGVTFALSGKSLRSQ